VKVHRSSIHGRSVGRNIFHGQLRVSAFWGRTPIGRATVEALRLNNEFIVIARQFWVEAGHWPPPDDLIADTT
jgi:hypothetical protein